MTVTLIDRTVCRQEVIITVTLHVPHENTCELRLNIIIRLCLNEFWQRAGSGGEAGGRWKEKKQRDEPMKGVFPTPDSWPLFPSDTDIQPKINVARHRHSELLTQHSTLHFRPTLTVSFPSRRRTFRPGWQHCMYVDRCVSKRWLFRFKPEKKNTSPRF